VFHLRLPFAPGSGTGRSTGRRIAAVAAAAAVLLGSSVGSTVAGGPGVEGGAPADAPANGRILFTRAVCASDEDPCWEIVVADADDRNEVVVAGPYPRSVWDDHFIANWAPDGRSVIFMADFGTGAAIWSVRPDGTGLHAILTTPIANTPHPGFDGLDDGPAFTPDGERIVFTRCCPQNSGYGLWSVRPDGTGLRLVTTEAVGPNVDGPSDNLPQVSPDGRLIAFHRNLNFCGCYIATVNFAGGRMRGLTDVELNGQIPNWSPDGRTLVFQAGGHVWAVGVDGSGLTQLTDDAPGTRSVNPSYSPDGRRIIFAHVDDTGRRELFTMDPDGSDWMQVTDTAGDEFFPHWAPQVP
jgi:Tol biopolymer transport system component